jgi:HAD superfamily hydrolase (TIGR01484 family)
MRSIAELTPPTARRLVGVFMDIDGTLTDEAGKLDPDAFAALWRLRRAGLGVVPVTGRPAGWCDLIVRQWPVDGVVGENGALAFWEAGGRLQRFFHPDVARGDTRARLDEVRDAVLAEVEGARVARDQFARMFDLAIDFCEEPPDLGLETADRIRAVFERFGARAKISNIHVNGWFGDYDKLAMVELFARERWQVDLRADEARYVFCGDSPNDEPMFAFFSHACAVANIMPFLSRLATKPRYVTTRAGGGGFTEMVDVLLRRRGHMDQDTPARNSTTQTVAPSR